jgi:hypothetical protein
MTILSTQERKYETKTFNENFAKKVQSAVPGNAKLKLPCIYNEKLSAIKASVSQPFVNVFI